MSVTQSTNPLRFLGFSTDNNVDVKNYVGDSQEPYSWWAGKKTVIVLLNGGAVAVEEEMKAANVAIIEAFYPVK